MKFIKSIFSLVVVVAIVAFMIVFKQTQIVEQPEKQAISTAMAQVEKHKQQLQATAMAAKQQVKDAVPGKQDQQKPATEKTGS